MSGFASGIRINFAPCPVSARCARERFGLALNLAHFVNGREQTCLVDGGAPLLAQGAASAIRRRLDDWLVKHQLRPRIVGEFDDPALMKAFGREGRGVFASPTVLEAETQAQYGVVTLARTDELLEAFYAISPERRISHPCVAAIADAARDRLLAG